MCAVPASSSGSRRRAIRAGRDLSARLQDAQHAVDRAGRHLALELARQRDLLRAEHLDATPRAWLVAQRAQASGAVATDPGADGLRRDVHGLAVGRRPRLGCELLEQQAPLAAPGRERDIGADHLVARQRDRLLRPDPGSAIDFSGERTPSPARRTEVNERRAGGDDCGVITLLPPSSRNQKSGAELASAVTGLPSNSILPPMTGSPSWHVDSTYAVLCTRSSSCRRQPRSICGQGGPASRGCRAEALGREVEVLEDPAGNHRVLDDRDQAHGARRSAGTRAHRSSRCARAT